MSAPSKFVNYSASGNGDGRDPGEPELRGRYDHVVNQNHAVFRLALASYSGPPPGDECEIICRGIPFELIGFDLLKFFSRFGWVYEMRVPMYQKLRNRNKGLAFVKYLGEKIAREAVDIIQGPGILPGRQLNAKIVAVGRCYVIVSNIPPSKTREILLHEFGRRTVGLKRVDIYPDISQMAQRGVRPNQGNCCLHYSSHYFARKALLLIKNDHYHYWGRKLTAEWGDPIEFRNSQAAYMMPAYYLTQNLDWQQDQYYKQQLEVFNVSSCNATYGSHNGSALFQPLPLDGDDQTDQPSIGNIAEAGDEVADDEVAGCEAAGGEAVGGEAADPSTIKEDAKPTYIYLAQKDLDELGITTTHSKPDLA